MSAGTTCEQVADHHQVGELPDGRVRVTVDGHDGARRLDTDPVLHGATDATREIEVRSDGLARLPDLLVVVDPPGVHRRSRRADGATERRGELVEQPEPIGPTDTSTAADHDAGLLDGEAESSPAGTCSTRATSDGHLARGVGSRLDQLHEPGHGSSDAARRPPVVRPRCRPPPPTNPLVVCSRPPKLLMPTRRPSSHQALLAPARMGVSVSPTSIPASARPSGSAPTSSMSCARSTWSMTSCAAPAAQGRAGAGGMPSTRGRYAASTVPAAAVSWPISRPATWTPPSRPDAAGQCRELQAQARRLTVDGATRPPRPWPSDEPPAGKEVDDRGRRLIGRRRSRPWRCRALVARSRSSPGGRHSPPADRGRLDAQVREVPGDDLAGPRAAMMPAQRRVSAARPAAGCP